MIDHHTLWRLCLRNRRTRAAVAAIGFVVGTLWTVAAQGATLDYWSFNETSGTIAHDSGTAGLDGTLQGGATFAPGIAGNGVQLDGTNGYVNMSTSGLSQVGSLGQGTISTWFKFDRTTKDNDILPVFYLGDGLGGAGHSAALLEIGHFDAGNTKAFFTIIADDMHLPQCFDSGVNLEPGKWYNFVAVVGPNGNTGFLNGKEMTDRHYNFGDASTTYFLKDVADQRVLWLGRGLLGRNTTEQYFDGAIDEVQVSDTPWTAAQAADYYKSVTDPPTPPAPPTPPPTPSAVPEPITALLVALAAAMAGRKAVRRLSGAGVVPAAE